MLPTAALFVLVACGQSAAPAATAKELDAKVQRVFALDARKAEEFAEQQKLLAELATVELDAAQEKSWRAKLVKLAAGAGPQLEKDSGKHWFWPEDKKGTKGRGLYIVGGATKKPKGLVIGMHGGGAGSGDAWTAHSALDSAARELDLLALYPEVLEKTERGWTDSGTEEFVVDLVEAAVRTWKLERERVYLAGHSMGGYGSWVIGARHADAFAGLAPSAGAPTPILGPGGVASDIDWGVIPNLRNLAIRIYQSDDDRNVPPDANRLAVKKLEEARARFGGFDFEYWEVPRRGHDLPPGGMKALLEKLEDKRRNARPAKVVWQPVLEWKRHFYWLWWDAPREGAIVEAELDAAQNKVRVSCDADATGLSVLLDDALVDLDKELVVELNGAEVFRGILTRDLGVLTRTALRNDPALTFSARVVLRE
jgi:pimeloyl-ACP methyl ester carboxylesterase